MKTAFTVTAAKDCTCGARDFDVCFCGLTYNEWVDSMKRQGKDYNAGVSHR